MVLEQLKTCMSLHTSDNCHLEDTNCATIGGTYTRVEFITIDILSKYTRKKERKKERKGTRKRDVCKRVDFVHPQSIIHLFHEVNGTMDLGLLSNHRNSSSSSHTEPIQVCSDNGQIT